MCGPTIVSTAINPEESESTSSSSSSSSVDNAVGSKAPLDVVLEQPSLLSRYMCASIMVTIFGVWGKIAFFGHGNEESNAPGIGSTIHSWKIPLSLTVSYLFALPILRFLSKKYLSQTVDVKTLLKETMVIYNFGQVVVNGWMIYRFIDALVNKDHPFIGDLYTVNSGATFAVYIHYMDKYLEFFDTFFMVLRGRMDQVSFLHIYHHISIAWAWWFAMVCYPGGDAYFGALLNSCIHVMMYSYYTLSLLKFSCPWKRYLTQAQLLQFTSVVVYTAISFVIVYRAGNAQPKHYACFVVQTFEMVSLFFLFMRFYSNAYAKKRKEQQQKLPSSSNASASSEDGSIPEQTSISSESSEEAASTKKSSGKVKKDL